MLVWANSARVTDGRHMPPAIPQRKSMGGTAMWKYTVEVRGMMCGMCETHTNEAIRKNFSVKKVSSSSKKAKTEILTEQKLDEAFLKRTIEELGYDVGTIQKETYQKKGLFGRL